MESIRQASAVLRSNEVATLLTRASTLDSADQGKISGE